MKRIIYAFFVLGVLPLLFGCTDQALDTYTITFESNGGTEVEQVEVEDGLSITEPTTPTKEGFTFLGWYSDSTFNHAFDFSSPLYGDLTLYAKWDVVSYTLTLLDYDGTVLSTTEVPYNTELYTVVETPTREGYAFSEWDLDVFSMPANDLTLQAEYSIIGYSVTYLDYDGTQLFLEVVPYNEPLNGFDVEIPEREGYQFLDWDNELPVTMPSEDLVFRAVYEEIVLDTCNGEEVNPDYFSVGFVTDVGGLDDGMYNENTFIGIEAFATYANIPTSNLCVLESSSDQDYETHIRTMINAHIDLIVLPGYIFSDVVNELAGEFPNQQFAILDAYVDASNVASGMFAEEQGAFLVGVVAALKAQEAGEDIVGFIGGMDFDIIQKFEAGFEAGVWTIDSSMTVLVDYANSFSDVNYGRTLAAKQYNDGAYIIFHASGAVGLGIIAEAKDRVLAGDEVWVIGADIDQYNMGLYDDTHSVVLTSAVKNLDNAAFYILNQTYLGNDLGGQLTVFDITLSGVGLPETNPNLSESILGLVETYYEGILDGIYVVPVVPSRLLF